MSVANMILSAAAAAVPAPDATAQLRAEVAPYLQCSAKFDQRRAEIRAKSEEVMSAINRASDRERLDANWEKNREATALSFEGGQLSQEIEETCKRAIHEQKLANAVEKLRPEGTTAEAHVFARRFLEQVERLDQDLAYFRAGYFKVLTPTISSPSQKPR